MPTVQFETFVTVTYTNTDSPVTINGNENYRFVTILVDSSSTANLTLKGSSSTSITLKAGESITLGSGESTINSITLTVPSGCTIYLIGLVRANLQQ